MRNKKKYGSRFGTIANWTMVAMFLAGWILIVIGYKNSEEFGQPGNERLIIGSVLIGASIVIAMIMPLLPSKLRGVNKMPFKVRVIQIVISLSVFIMLGGFGWIVASMVKDPENQQNFSALIGAGIFAVGFAVAWIAASIRDKMVERGEAPPDSHILSRAESDINEDEFGLELLQRLTGQENMLSPEERERELRRIEEQDLRSGAAPMTKEQVEEYENRKHF